MVAPSRPPVARVGQGLRRGEAAGRRVPGVGVGRVDVSPHGDVGRPPVGAGQVVTPVMYGRGRRLGLGPYVPSAVRYLEVGQASPVGSQTSTAEGLCSVCCILTMV